MSGLCRRACLFWGTGMVLFRLVFPGGILALWRVWFGCASGERELPWLRRFRGGVAQVERLYTGGHNKPRPPVDEGGKWTGWHWHTRNLFGDAEKISQTYSAIFHHSTVSGAVLTPGIPVCPSPGNGHMRACHVCRRCYCTMLLPPGKSAHY